MQDRLFNIIGDLNDLFASVKLDDHPAKTTKSLSMISNSLRYMNKTLDRDQVIEFIEENKEEFEFSEAIIASLVEPCFNPQ